MSIIADTEHGGRPKCALCDKDFDSGSCAGSIPTQCEAFVNTNSLVSSITQPVLAGIEQNFKLLNKCTSFFEIFAIYSQIYS